MQLVGYILIKVFSLLCEIETSVPCLQQPSTSCNRRTRQTPTSTHTQTSVSVTHALVLSLHLLPALENHILPSGCPTKTMYIFSRLCSAAVRHTNFISLYLVTPIILVNRTDYEAHPQTYMYNFLQTTVISYVLTSYIIIIIIQYVCLLSQAFLPGTSLEPAVIPTAHASSFTLQYFPHYV